MRLGDGALAQGFGGGLVVVFIEHGGETRAHMPLDIIGQHAQEHVGADPILEPMMDRPDMQIDRLQATGRSTRLNDL